MPNESSGYSIPAYIPLYLAQLNSPIKLFLRRMQVIIPSVYCFGFLSNIIVLWIFFSDGFASTSNINFFSLGVADLCVCIFFLVRELFQLIGRYFRGQKAFQEISIIYSTYFFSNNEALKSFSAWITALITLERLICIIFPLKVGP